MVIRVRSLDDDVNSERSVDSSNIRFSQRTFFFQARQLLTRKAMAHSLLII